MKIGKVFPLAISNLFKKPATIAYPAVKVEMPENFRGMLEFNQDNCIGCNMCVRNCPAKAIEITRVSEEEKKFKASVYLDRCIYCGQCVDSCVKNALKCTTSYELANPNRKNLKVDI